MENPKLDEIGSGTQSSIREEIEEKGAQKITVANQIKAVESEGHKADSFMVDIERFSSPLPVKDVKANSRITKSLSRKGMQRSGEKRTGFSVNEERDHSPVATSPRAATLRGTSTPEKPMVVVVGATDHSINPQLHNCITITVSGGGGAAAAESKVGGRRFGFRRPPSSWTPNPRRILLFFATISSVGTILLIYFTLSISKLNGYDNVLQRQQSIHEMTSLG